MIGVVVLCHGLLAQALADTAQMIVGPQPLLAAVPFTADMRLDDYQASVSAALKAAAGDGGGDAVLVLADLAGGTPCNVGLVLAGAVGARNGNGAGEIAVVSGVNVPMLVTVLLGRGSSGPSSGSGSYSGPGLAELKTLAQSAGVEGIQAIDMESGGCA